MSLSNPSANPGGPTPAPTGPTRGAQQTQPTADRSAPPMIRWLLIPAAFSLMEAQVVALVALFLLLVIQVDIAGAVLSLFGLTIWMALCVWGYLGYVTWVATLSRRARELINPFFHIGVLVLIGVLLYLQVTVFLPVAPIIPLVVVAVPTAGAFLYLYLRAISFVQQYMRQPERPHRWLLTSFKWELGVIAVVFLLAAPLMYRLTFYVTSLVALPLFIAGGLIAISLARMIALRTAPAFVETDANAGGAASPQRWYRFLSLFGLTALIGVLAIDLLYLTGVFNLLGPLGAAMAGGIGHAFGAFGSWLSHLFPQSNSQPHGGQGGQTPSGGTTTTGTTSAPAPSNSSAPLSIDPNVVLAIMIGLLVVVLGLVAIWLISFIRQLAREGLAAALRRLLRLLVFGLLALAALLLLMLLYSAVISRLIPPSSVAHLGGASIPLPFQLPSWLVKLLGISVQPGGSSSGATPVGGTTTTTRPGTPKTPAPPHLPSINTPLNWLLFVLYALAALAVLALVIFLVVVGVRALLQYLRWRRARKADTPATADADEDAPAPAAPMGDLARYYYRQLLQAAAEVGGVYARRANETPTEYARRLGSLLAQPNAPLALQQAAQGIRGAQSVQTVQATPSTNQSQPVDPTEIAETTRALDDLTSAYRVARYRGDATDAARGATLRQRLGRLLTALGRG